MRTGTREKDKLSEILDMLPAFIYVQNPDHTIEFYNREFYNLFGEPKGRKCYEIFKNEPCVCNPCIAENVLDTKEPNIRKWQDREGRFYMRYHYFFTDADGISKVLGAGVDISRQVANRKALKESEERYKHLFEHTPAMLHSIDTEGRIIYVSDQWLNLLGYAREEAVGKTFIDFLSDESRRLREGTSFPDLLRTGECSDIHYQYLSKNGRDIDVLISAVPEKSASPDKRLILAVSIDVTERLKTEKALQRIHENLESQVQKERRLIYVRRKSSARRLKSGS